MAWTDAELVQQTLEGSREAFGALVERHRRTVYALALQRGLQPAEAEDVAQEVFIKAYAGLGTLNAPAHFARWLFGIAAHAMADAARGRRRRSLERSDAEAERAAREAPWQPSGDRAPLSLEEDTAHLMRAMQDLSEDHQRVVTLRYMHGMSPKQIAETLGEPRGTVRSRLHHALAHLQKALGATRSARESARLPGGGERA